MGSMLSIIVIGTLRTWPSCTMESSSSSWCWCRRMGELLCWQDVERQVDGGHAGRIAHLPRQAAGNEAQERIALGQRHRLGGKAQLRKLAIGQGENVVVNIAGTSILWAGRVITTGRAVLVPLSDRIGRRFIATPSRRRCRARPLR